MILATLAIVTLQSVPEVLEKVRPLRPRTSPATWLTDDDYPEASLKNKEFGIVEFRLEIDPRGNLAACRILVSSGFWRLDQQTCAIMMKRARFKAARGAAGEPIPATFQSRFSWLLPESKQDYVRLANEMASVVDLTVSLNRLPADYKQPASIRVRFDRDNKVAECSIEGSSGNGKLNEIACQQARSDVAKPPYRKGLVTQPDTRMVRVTFVGDGKAQ
jgi:TonB family protein